MLFKYSEKQQIQKKKVSEKVSLTLNSVFKFFVIMCGLLIYVKF